ncbi:glycosyltransferase family 2 protein [Planococcus salinus]|uniref:Glycosyltransferase family 2 protein n=1 Tax=Planococcus salinus TaxID=1848460 RepID=A0A3M8P766_9BACL|nr:glycosyltransferase family 2 protein [Planococcus salinus]RNF39517.1 glycosyltransferase family 2 protein [Planococcus salinus]
MVNENEKTSIIIPTYNRAELLKKAVVSLLSQTHQNIEIIIVDDCSTDNTSEVVSRMTDPRILYIKHQTNKGGASARNTGIAHATGEYVGFLDSDDQWLPEKLEKQLQVFRRDPEIGVVYTGLRVTSESGVLREMIPVFRGKILSKLLQFNCIDTTSSIIVKKELLDKIGGFDAAFPSCQDWDLYLRLAQITRFDFVQEPLVLFFQHSGERITSNKKAVQQGHIFIYEKYRDLACRQEDEVYRKFVINITKIILRTGIMNQDKKAVKLSRKLYSEGIKGHNVDFKNKLIYFSTFINLKVLLFLYVQSKKSSRNYYSFSDFISLEKNSA